MDGEKESRFAALKKEILLMQGYKPADNTEHIKIGRDSFAQSFPNRQFPTGVIHEFLCNTVDHTVSTYGFVAGIVGALIKGGVIIWIESDHMVYPPGIKQFNISPEQIVFIRCKKEKEILWVTEQALKSSGVSAVVTAVNSFNFTNSRRLQLAVEQSRTTGFILLQSKNAFNTSAAIARWRIQPVPSVLENSLPGVGHPRWKVELLKVRNGNSGEWIIEWKDGQLQNILPEAITRSSIHKKAV